MLCAHARDGFVIWQCGCSWGSGVRCVCVCACLLRVGRAQDRPPPAVSACHRDGPEVPIGIAPSTSVISEAVCPVVAYLYQQCGAVRRLVRGLWAGERHVPAWPPRARMVVSACMVLFVLMSAQYHYQTFMKPSKRVCAGSL